MKLVLLKKHNKKISDFIFSLKNKDYVRLQSLNKKKINFKHHEYWLKKNLKEPTNKIYILKKENKNLGYIRIEKNQSFRIVSWALLKQFQNKGIMTLNLTKATSKKNVKYKAIIKKLNLASIKIATKSGFKKKFSKKNFAYFFKN